MAGSNKLKGVNLGGWLAVERWLVPSVFGRHKAEDEHTLCEKLGDKKRRVFKNHRDNFITEQDFTNIAASGFNAVRLPVGHWLFGGYTPFISSSSYVVKALDWAHQAGLKVILDLHTAPGSQSGWVSSGWVGEPAWHKNPKNIDRTVEIIGRIAQEYGSHPSLWGIELLNEPHPQILLSTLQDYYRRAYREARRHTTDNMAIIISDAYRPIVEWSDFVHSSEFKNMFLDIHLYQTFSESDKNLSFEEHIAKTLKWKKMIEAFGSEKIIVGEWSVVAERAYDGMSHHAAQEARKLYFQAQQYAFSDCRGHFYWTYKTEKPDDWNYRDFVKKLTVI